MTDAGSEPCRVDGATRLYGIIGDPIEQVRSPQVFNPRLSAAGRNAVLVPMHVRPERFEATVAGLMALGNLDGLIITVPYKVRALALPFPSGGLGCLRPAMTRKRALASRLRTP